MAIFERHSTFEYKELTNENTRIKELIKKRYGYFNEEAIERLYDETKIMKESIIDIIEGGDGPHDISEYKALAFVLSTSIDYIAGLAISDEPYEWFEFTL